MPPNSALRLTAAAAVLSLASCVVHAQAQDGPANSSLFTSSDRNLSFQYPADWTAAEDSGRIRLTAPDGSKYVISRDSLSPAPTGNAANNTAVQQAAARLAHPLLTDGSYAGVKLLTVDAGTGAIYRYRGKGSKSDYDLAEVWVAVIGAHNVVMVPATAPQPDHFYELSTLFRSMAFADTPKPTAGGAAGKGAQNQAGAGANRTNSAAGTFAPPGSGLGASSAAIQRGVVRQPAADTEMERYDGHLIPGDGGFTLRVNHGPTATATWSRTVGTASYTGTYTGEEGNYSVSLTRAQGAPLGLPETIKLTLRSTGGMVAGTYISATTPAARQIAELRLTEVDAGNIRLHAGSLNNANSNRANKRNSQRRINPGTVVGGGINVVQP